MFAIINLEAWLAEEAAIVQKSSSDQEIYLHEWLQKLDEYLNSPQVTRVSFSRSVLWGACWLCNSVLLFAFKLLPVNSCKGFVMTMQEKNSICLNDETNQILFYVGG